MEQTLFRKQIAEENPRNEILPHMTFSSSNES